MELSAGGVSPHLEAFDGQLQDVGRELGGLFEGEVAPVDDEDEPVDLQLRVLYQNLQGQQDGPQDVGERVPDGGEGGGDYTQPQHTAHSHSTTEASILCPDCCWDGGEVLKCSVGSVYINTINHH